MHSQLVSAKLLATGLYNGHDIEDVGIKDRYCIRPQWSDLQPGSTTNNPIEPYRQKPCSYWSKERSDALGNSHITIVGKTAGKQVLKTNRNASLIPLDSTNPQLPPGEGWNNLNGPWMIGNGFEYASDVDSSLEAFFTAPVGTQINIGLNVALDTDPEFDFLYCLSRQWRVVEDFLTRSKSLDGKKTFNGISGRDMLFEETFSFTTKSEKFSVSL
ncbi:hypothetical protein BASA84_001615, partial [Batrachochytrium salamandrivorans]